MIFPKLSIFVAATLVAFAAPSEGQTSHRPKCGNNPVKCCLDSFPATAVYTILAKNRLGVDIPVGTNVWADCSDKTPCRDLTVCCDMTASDGSIAIGCKCIGDCN